MKIGMRRFRFFILLGISVFSIIGLHAYAVTLDVYQVSEMEDDGTIFLDTPAGITTTKIGSSTYAVVVAQADNAMVIIDITTPSDPTVVSTTIDTDTTLLGGPINVDTISLPTDISSNETNSVYAVLTSDEDGIQISDPTLLSEAAEGQISPLLEKLSQLKI